jgi:hypothetical protein
MYLSLMKKTVFFLALLGVFSCGEKQLENQAETSANLSLDYSDLPDFTSLSFKADSIVKVWPAFDALDQRMTALKLVVSLPDLKMLVSELIEKEGAILKDGYPKDFNTPEVKSRQRLLRTYLLKTQALINQSQDPKAAALEAVEAFNALKEQLNRHTVVPVNLNDFKNVP